MPVLARIVATPVTIEVRRGAISSLGGLLADGRISSGGDVLVAIGSGIGEQVRRRVTAAVPAAEVLEIATGDLDGAQDLIGRLRGRYADALVGIGGGRTLDVAKYAASMVGLPFVSVATSLAHDGLASPVASLDARGRKASFGVQAPLAVFVDLDFVRSAPLRQLRAGVGEVLSNLCAVADWELASDEVGERRDGLSVLLARNAAEAVLGSEDALPSYAFLHTLAEALIASGLAMAVAGSSRPCSGACHEISHSLDAFHGAPGLHGEQVGIGALFVTWLRGDDRLAARMDACLRRHGAARVPADIGVSAGTFAAALARAPATRPERYTLLEHLDLSGRELRDRVDRFVAAFAG
jgi:glycerol-1-phosphate dehydrogenase [NAD(P)+]